MSVKKITRSPKTFCGRLFETGIKIEWFKSNFVSSWTYKCTQNGQQKSKIVPNPINPILGKLHKSYTFLQRSNSTCKELIQLKSLKFNAVSLFDSDSRNRNLALAYLSLCSILQCSRSSLIQKVSKYLVWQIGEISWCHDLGSWGAKIEWIERHRLILFTAANGSWDRKDARLKGLKASQKSKPQLAEQNWG